METTSASKGEVIFVNKPESSTLLVSVAAAKVRKGELGGGAERTGWT